MNTNGPEIGARASLKLNIPPSVEGLEVLFNSYTLDGEHLPLYLYRKTEEPNNAGVLLNGESGGTKSTATGQWLKILAGSRVLTHALTTGIFLDRLSAYIGQRVRRNEPIIRYTGPTPQLGSNRFFDRSQMTDDLWRYGAQELVGDINEAAELALRSDRVKDPSKPPVPWRMVGDIAGFGNSLVTARLASRLGEVATAFPTQVAFLIYPGNPDIQDGAYTSRVEATSLMEKLSQARGSERILSADRILRHALKSEEEAEVKEFFDKRHIVPDTDLVSALATIIEGTRPDRFNRVRATAMEEVNSWVDTQDYKTMVAPVDEKLTCLEAEGKFKMKNPDNRDQYVRKLAYAQNYYLPERLGIPVGSDQAKVVVVTHLDETIHQFNGLLHSKSY